MRDVLLIENASQAAGLLSPIRIEILKRADEPRTCAELAVALGKTPQKIYYHVKVLERAGALEKVEERRVRAIPEGYYRATARAYWFSPKLIGRIGGQRRARDQMSLGSLLGLAEELQADVGRLAETEREDAPALGFSAQIRLARADDRTALLSDIQNAIQSIAKKYGAAGPSRPQAREGAPGVLRLILACYPRTEDKAG